MKRHFVISDLHLGHLNIVKFCDKDGNRIRPFESIEKHDETILTNWNNVVTPEDTVYVLGDVVINKNSLGKMNAFHGRKILVKGNHDIFDLRHYMPYFDDIRACIVRNNMIFSHIPVHDSQLERWAVNVHGHLHQNLVTKIVKGRAVRDNRYLNVCCEHTNFTPVLLDKIIAYRDEIEYNPHDGYVTITNMKG
jgi:calcineurin-like phosphoesterase family protein